MTKFCKFFLTLSIVCAHPCFGQVVEYFDEAWKPCEKRDAVFYRKIKYDRDGNPVGTVRDYYITGELQWDGKIIANKVRDSICTWYLRSGQITRRISYDKGVFHGDYIDYDENGQMKKIATYRYGKRVASSSRYNNEWKTTFKCILDREDSTKNHCIGYNEQGQVTFFEDATKKISYNDNGQILESTLFIAGQRHGMYQRFYTNGQIAVESTYDQGKLNGQHTEYYENGNVLRSATYSQGKLHGISTSYFQNGKVQYESTFKNDIPEGEFKEFDKDGQLVRSIFYVGGKELTRYPFEFEGQMYYERSFDSTRKIEIYSGRAREEYSHKLFILPNGTKIFRGESKNSLRVSYRYPSGIRIDTSWLDGKVRKISSHDGKTQREKVFDKYGILIFSEPKSEASLQPSRDPMTALFGYKNQKDDWIIAPKYKMASKFLNRYSVFSEKDKYGVIDIQGRFVIKPEFESIRHLHDPDQKYVNDPYKDYLDESLVGDFFVVKKSGKSGVIRASSGANIVPLEYDSISDIKNDFMTITSDGKEGLATTEGVTLEPKYFKLWWWWRGYIMFQPQADQPEMGIMDSSGNIIIPPRYSNISYDGSLRLFIARKDSLKGLIDLNGKVVLDPRYTFNDRTSEKTIVIKYNGRVGVFRAPDKMIIPCVFDRVEPLGGRDGSLYFLASEQGRVKLLFEDGRQALPGDYPYFKTSYQEDGIYLTIGNEKSVSFLKIDSSLTRVELSKEIEFNQNGVGLLKIDESKVGLVTNKGQVLVAPTYHPLKRKYQGASPYLDLLQKMLDDERRKKSVEVIETTNGFDIVVTENSKVGVMNSKTGRLVVDTVYDVMSNYVDEFGAFWAKKLSEDWADFENNDWGLVDTTGRFLLPPEFEHPGLFYGGGCMKLSKSGRWGLLDKNKKQILPFEYDQIEFLNEKLLSISKNGKLGLATTRGKVLFQPRWSYMTGFFETGYAVVYDEERKQQGILNSDGELVLPMTTKGYMRTSAKQFITLFLLKSDDAATEEIILKEQVDGFLKIDSIRSVIAREIVIDSLISGNSFDVGNSTSGRDGEPIPNFYYDQENLGNGSPYYSDFWPHEISTSILNASRFHVSLVKSESERYEWGSEVNVYQIIGDSVRAIELGDIFFIDQKFFATLAKLITDRGGEVPDEYQHHFDVNPNGLVFYNKLYFRWTDEINDFSDEQNSILISYELLRSFIRKDGLVAKFLKK